MKIVNTIQVLYMFKDFRCTVICGNQLTDSFRVQTGVKQECILSPFLFILAMDLLMGHTNKGQSRGIQWRLTSSLEDLVFADDTDQFAVKPSSRHSRQIR